MPMSRHGHFCGSGALEQEDYIFLTIAETYTEPMLCQEHKEACLAEKLI